MSIEDYYKYHIRGKHNTLAERITQYIHDCINSPGMHNWKDCDLVDKGSWSDGLWKRKCEEIQHIIDEELPPEE
jgi:hypothetical protein